MSSSKIIQISSSNLVVSYDSIVALYCDKLSIAGSVIGVIGHNGAGKSTFIKSLLKLLPPNKGDLKSYFDEMELQPEVDMAFCPETGAVFADISVESYVKLWCRIKHNDSKYYLKEGRKYYDLLELGPLMPKLGRELSKGQRRRVQTAIGFLTSPKLFLFDEPFDGLDVQRTRELADIIISHREKMGFVISSHRMDVMERVADVIIVLQNGKFIHAGTTENVCQELAGRSFIIRVAGDSSEIVTKLSSHFPRALVNRIGNQISVTGKDVAESSLSEVISNSSLPAAIIEEVRPQLVEAMNYHLHVGT